MQDLEGIVGRTRERVCLDLEMNTTHDLTTWALPNELTDHPVSYGGVVDSFPCQTLPPMSVGFPLNVLCTLLNHF